MTSDQPLFDPSLRSAPVEAVARKDQEIVAVGDLGTIICSEDGGGSWKAVNAIQQNG